MFSLCFPYVSLMFSLCFPYVFLMISLYFHYGFLTNMFPLCFPYDLLMFSLCFPYVFRMISLYFPYVFLMFSLGPMCRGRCAGADVLGPMCWGPCAGAHVLGPMCWAPCAGAHVLGPMCWGPCAPGLLLRGTSATKSLTKRSNSVDVCRNIDRIGNSTRRPKFPRDADRHLKRDNPVVAKSLKKRSNSARKSDKPRQKRRAKYRGYPKFCAQFKVPPRCSPIEMGDKKGAQKTVLPELCRNMDRIGNSTRRPKFPRDAHPHLKKDTFPKVSFLQGLIPQ